MSGVTYDRRVTYEQAQKMLRYMGGIHAALTKDIEPEDCDFLYRTVVAGGAPLAYPVGSIVWTEKGNYKYPWAVMHHGEHEDGRPYMILRVIKAVDLLMFDAQEAFYYCEESLPAGTYYFEVTTAYGQLAAENYQFTLASAVPAGGRLGFNVVPYNTSPIGKLVQVYDSANSMVVSQTATISSGNSGTKLGVLAAGGDPDVANMNSVQRCCFGSTTMRSLPSGSISTAMLWPGRYGNPLINSIWLPPGMHRNPVSSRNYRKNLSQSSTLLPSPPSPTTFSRWITQNLRVTRSKINSGCRAVITFMALRKVRILTKNSGTSIKVLRTSTKSCLTMVRRPVFSSCAPRSWATPTMCGACMRPRAHSTTAVRTTATPSLPLAKSLLPKPQHKFSKPAHGAAVTAHAPIERGRVNVSSKMAA